MYDVCAVSDTEVWIVGEIEKQPIDGRDVYFNVMRWNGREWNRLRVPMYDEPPQPRFPRFRAVYAVTPDHVLFAIGNSLVRWNGESFSEDNRLLQYVGQGGIQEIWGSSPDDVYLVGTDGYVVHYDGEKYQKLSTGTTYDFNDIWGVGDTAVAVASNWLFDHTYSYLLRLVHGKTLAVPEWNTRSLGRAHKSIWFEHLNHLHVVGGFIQEWKGDEWWTYLSHNLTDLSAFSFKIRGNAENDFFISGDLGLLVHWNGNSWQRYNPFDEEQRNYYHSMSVQADHVWVITALGEVIHGTRVP